jgi:hypothetical protein
MATLNADLAARLRAALKAQNLTMRNWSAPGDWCFAIYASGDEYVGTVRLDADACHLSVRDAANGSAVRMYKRDASVLAALCWSFNSNPTTTSTPAATDRTRKA